MDYLTSHRWAFMWLPQISQIATDFLIYHRYNPCESVKSVGALKTKSVGTLSE